MSETDAGEEKQIAVVFHAFWSDTTRHGVMIDHQPSPEPVTLPQKAAVAAVAAGKAKRWKEDRTSESEAAE
ncbi:MULTISPECIES: hypothetical protein [Hyphomonas]|uniref:Uncharacterized protein n=1 Tax=Hyphomonas adhaerens TaxID=81029 RepID=A0A3B9GUJ0_9PROT|nr:MULTISPECIES: hypothetical protein [Hyphomonas]MBB40960.1 hypothetical protein [Hyphomonas sp.]HAE25684.1 hypothetical protein [Hyphomonas adhaerens]|tara:strand:- start:282 stop:494 length:213 start_codon:yes stop_codon:yes gene_type:complete